MLLKQGDDAYRAKKYTAAKSYWESVLKLAPENTHALTSLAQLHTVDIKDYAKAEMYYLKAATSVLNGYNSSTYRMLLEFYTNTGYKSASNAYEVAAKQAIKANPKAIDFQVLLARYYVSKDRTAEAKSQFESAAKVAEAAGNTALATQIRSEASAL